MRASRKRAAPLAGSNITITGATNREQITSSNKQSNLFGKCPLTKFSLRREIFLHVFNIGAKLHLIAHSAVWHQT